MRRYLFMRVAVFVLNKQKEDGISRRRKVNNVVKAHTLLHIFYIYII